MADLTQVELELPSDVISQAQTASKSILTKENEKAADENRLVLEEEAGEDEEDFSQQRIKHLKPGMRVVVMRWGWRRVPKYLEREWAEVLEVKRRVVKVNLPQTSGVTEAKEDSLELASLQGTKANTLPVSAKTHLRTVVTSITVKPVDARPDYPHIRPASQFILGPQNSYLVESEERRLEREHLREQLRLIREYHQND